MNFWRMLKQMDATCFEFEIKFIKYHSSITSYVLEHSKIVGQNILKLHCDGDYHNYIDPV